MLSLSVLAQGKRLSQLLHQLSHLDVELFSDCVGLFGWAQAAVCASHTPVANLGRFREVQVCTLLYVTFFSASPDQPAVPAV